MRAIVINILFIIFDLLVGVKNVFYGESTFVLVVGCFCFFAAGACCMDLIGNIIWYKVGKQLGKEIEVQ